MLKKGYQRTQFKVRSSGYRLTEQNCLNHIPTCIWIRKASKRVKPRPLCKHSRGIYHTIKEQRVAQIITQGKTI